MNTNQARAYEEIDAANTDWLNSAQALEAATAETSTQDTRTGETTEAGVIRLRLNLRDRRAPGAEAADETARKRTKRPLAPTEKDQTPPPRPRIVWRREDANETRPAPSIIME